MDKKYRANSYIENYNRQLKIKLSQLIYGKDKSYLSWPLFIKFIQNEEEEYRRNNGDLENSIIKKNIIKDIKYNNSTKCPNIKFENKIILRNNLRKWLKYDSFSCRFDSFSVVYSFIYDDYINYYKMKETNIIKFWNNMCKEIETMDIIN